MLTWFSTDFCSRFNFLTYMCACCRMQVSVCLCMHANVREYIIIMNYLFFRQMWTTMSPNLHVCTICHISIPIILIIFAASVTSQYVPHLPPFFFLCNYHGKPQQSHLDSGEVAISVAIAGNPENYIPESLYESEWQNDHYLFSWFIMVL